MRAAAVLGCLLLACMTAAEAAIISNTTFVGCSNFKAILGRKDLKDLWAAVVLIQNLDLLPAGIPDDATIFLPTNSSLEAVLIGGPIPTPSSDLDVILSKPLIPEIAYRLNAIFLHHIAIIGAATPDELADEQTIPTALGPDHPLTFEEVQASGRKVQEPKYTLTDGTGRVANVGRPLSLCASSIYPIDKVMLPAESFIDIPLVTPAESLCLTTGIGCWAPVLSVGSPSLPSAPVSAPAAEP